MSVPGPQLIELARRFPQGFVESKGGNDYVAHHIINQRLLTVVGPFDFELMEVFRGDVAAIAPNPRGNSKRAKEGSPALHDAVVGASYRLTVTIDGRKVTITDVGDVGDPHNWPHDGARLKDAASDALKRCAMRLGLGLHLWAQEHYFLDKQLEALAVRTGDAGPAQSREDASPANLEETVARPRPAPTEPEPARPSRFGDRAAQATGTTTQETARVLAEQGDSEAAERLAYPDQVRRAAAIRLQRFVDANPELSLPEREKVRQDLLEHFSDHPEEAVTMEAPELASVVDKLRDGGLEPEVLAVEDNDDGPVGDTDGAEYPPGWEPEEASTQADTQPSTQDDDDGEVLPLQALADRYAGGNFFHIAGALRKENPEWEGKSSGWFNRLTADDLALANTLVRRHWAKKRAEAERKAKANA